MFTSDFVAFVRVVGCESAADALRDLQASSQFVWDPASTRGVYLATEVLCEREFVFSRTDEGAVHREVKPMTCLGDPRKETFYYEMPEAAVRCEEVRLGGARIFYLSQECCDAFVRDIPLGRWIVRANCVKPKRRATDFDPQWDDQWDDQGNLRFRP